MKLIPDWKRAWRYFSMQAIGVAVAALGAWAALPVDLKAALPAEWVQGFAIVVLILGMIGRVVSQSGEK